MEVKPRPARPLALWEWYLFAGRGEYCGIGSAIRETQGSIYNSEKKGI